jgi:hypothetical protein
VKYELVSGINKQDFVARVNGLISEGWEPFGGPSESDSGGFHQAMIKKEPTLTKWMERFEVESNAMTGEDRLIYKANNGKKYTIHPEKIIHNIELAQENPNG